MKRRYTPSDFEEHIKGSGGIIDVVATRTGCSWRTAKRHLEQNPRLKMLFDAESASALDWAESVIIENIWAARRQQQEAEAEGRDVPIVDSSDAKWFLSRKGKGRGDGDATAVTLRTAPGRIEIVTLREKMVALGVSEEFLPEL